MTGFVHRYRQQHAYARNPKWCVCVSRPDAPSTHRAPAHLTSCKHSTLRETTMARRPLPTLRPVLGTRRVIAVDL